MDATDLRELASGLQADHEHGDSPGPRLCRACVDLIAIGGAGIMLMDEHGNATSLELSDPVTRVVEDLQFTLGEGPGIDAHALDRPILRTAAPGTVRGSLAGLRARGGQRRCPGRVRLPAARRRHPARSA
jgi:hypothetical protein